MSDISDTISSLNLGLKPLSEGIIDIKNLEYSTIEFTKIFDKGLNSKKWYILESNSQSIFNIIRLDTSQNIIAGTFEFVLLNANRQDTLYITDGRFDVIYYQQ